MMFWYGLFCLAILIFAIVVGIANGKQSGTDRVMSFIINGLIVGYVVSTMVLLFKGGI